MKENSNLKSVIDGCTECFPKDASQPIKVRTSSFVTWYNADLKESEVENNG